MTNIVVIQARTNSSRLPGKVLLPIAGLPIVVLAAKRAANTGQKVVVAISKERTDDSLAEVLRSYNIECYRGDLENVLGRFVDLLRDFDGQDTVCRLTADNVLPDGHLIDEVEKHFHENNLDYLACNGAQSGLPYGVSLEITRVGHLREAGEHAEDPADFEHVTPYVARKFGRTYFTKYAEKRMGHYRCTIDCLDDYLVIEKLFRGASDPVNTCALDLVDQLRGFYLQPQVERPINKLVLGAAQLGLNYGVSNIHGKPSLETSRRLIKTAIVNGVEFIDTARAYGNSEEVIRHSLSDGWQGRAHIVTKIMPLEHLSENASPSVIDAFVDASLYRSMVSLGVQKIDTMLLHRACDLNNWNGRVWKRLIEHQDEGRVQNLGVSVQSVDELLQSLDVDTVSHIQLPFNILDRRWDDYFSYIEKAKSERNLTIHVRSVLLQGLLVNRDIKTWRRAHIDDPIPVWEWLDGMQEEFQRSSLADLCIGFVAGMPWVDGIVIGVETIEQLLENLKLLGGLPLSDLQIEIARRSRPKVDLESVNPALWKAAQP